MFSKGSIVLERLVGSGGLILEVVAELEENGIEG